MGWIKDNERIVAMYMGERVTGIVESSRVKYGSNVRRALRIGLLTLPKHKCCEFPTNNPSLDSGIIWC